MGSANALANPDAQVWRLLQLEPEVNVGIARIEEEKAEIQKPEIAGGHKMMKLDRCLL